MATTVTTQTTSQTDAPDPLPEVANAFVADRQAFWTRFTSFVTMATAVVVVLLILMAIFLT